MQQRRKRPLSHMMAQIQDLQNKVNSLSDTWNSLILNPGAALERPTFLIKLLRFWVPEPCCDSGLYCNEIHRIARVLWETFLNDHLLKNYNPLQSSTIQRIWHLHLKTWELIFQRQQGETWKGNHWIRQLKNLTSKVEMNFGSHWWILFSRYDGLSENSSSEWNHGKKSWLFWNVQKLEA